MPGPVLSGTPNIFPAKVFETNVAAVVAGLAGLGGWVSGSPASLAASGSVDCIFDLGQDWHQFPTVQVAFVPVAPSTTSTALAVGSDTAAFNGNRPLVVAASAAAGTGVAAFTTTAQSWLVRPMGRYFVVRVANTDASNAMGAGAKVTITAYPD